MHLKILFVVIIFAQSSNGAEDEIFCRSRNKFEKLPTFSNSLSIVDCANEDLDLKGLKGKIEKFNASSNSIIELKSEVFESATNLTVIDLSNNRIEKVSCLAFSNQNKLKNLALAYNKIKNLCEGTFNQLAEIEELNLQNNQLSVIRKKLFSKNLKLKLLNLASNGIVAIEYIAFENVPSQITILAYNNTCTINDASSKNEITKFSECFDSFKNNKYLYDMEKRSPKFQIKDKKHPKILVIAVLTLLVAVLIAAYVLMIVMIGRSPDDDLKTYYRRNSRNISEFPESEPGMLTWPYSDKVGLPSGLSNYDDLLPPGDRHLEEDPIPMYATVSKQRASIDLEMEEES